MDTLMIKVDEGTMPVHTDNGKIILIDQRKLPDAIEYFDATDIDQMCFAIVDMVVRGAPSIGVAAALSMAAHLQKLAGQQDSALTVRQFDEAKSKLDATRPTAVNLRWATSKVHMFACFLLNEKVDNSEFGKRIFEFAEHMLQDHLDRNRKLSDFGLSVVPQSARIITHCNAGSLAACGWGTALGVIRSAHAKGLKPSVFVDETRPRNQGSKLTMWELTQDGVPATLICDNMSGYLMQKGDVDMVITGADRIAANGDSANKIGTYPLAVLANHHAIPFYIAAPLSTFDPLIESGEEIPIEFRNKEEVLSLDGRTLTVNGAEALNPAFDVTPNQLIKGIITEEGVLRPPYKESIAAALKRNSEKATKI
jgi:methylthioribose-1-phosphate isomerase